MCYCSQCGKELPEGAAFCPSCGSTVGEPEGAAAQPEGGAQTYQQPVYQQPPYQQPVYQQPAAPSRQEPSVLQTIAKVFLIIGCVCSGIFLFPLAWTVPMTVVYCNKVRDRQPVGTGFKVCTLLFVSLIAGILMLCDESN